MAQSNITFVTCFFQIYEKEPIEFKNFEWRLEHFESIAQLGLNICVYGNDKSLCLLEDRLAKYPHVKLLQLETPYEETFIHKLCYSEELNLATKNIKDTKEYLTLMHSKIEFVHDAIHKNPFGSDIFAWMDFSMAYLFKNKEETLKKLQDLPNRHFPEMFLWVPGCWSKFICLQLHNVNWRFCGTFFIGDKESIQNFYELYQKHFPIFLHDYKTLTWEVNFWTWLEKYANWSVQWYSSNHDDLLLALPTEIKEHKE